MHSPEVLAFSIWRPWPVVHKKPMGRNNPKWALPIRRRVDGSHYISRFAYVNGIELYFPSFIDVWHMEPGGHDSLTICKDRKLDSAGKFVKWSHTWKLHFWHWHITWPALHELRRRIFTRCAECGGPSRKGNMVNHSNGGWSGGPKVPFWCGEVHLFHSDCLSKLTRRQHEHDPRGCYSCSGKEAFSYKRQNTTNVKLPLITPKMPLVQRRTLSSLHALVDMRIVPYALAVKRYNAAKDKAAWL